MGYIIPCFVVCLVIQTMNLLSTLFSFLIIIFLFYLLCFVFVVRVVCRRDVNHHTVLLLLLLVVESAVQSLSNFPVALSRRVAVSHPSPKYLKEKHTRNEREKGIQRAHVYIAPLPQYREEEEYPLKTFQKIHVYILYMNI